MQIRIISFILFIFIFGFLRAGDTPCTATFVANNMSTFQTFNTAGTSDSGLGYPPCGNYEGNDFWIEFTAPLSGVVTVELQAGTIIDAALNFYWGLCGGFQIVDLGCYEDFDCGTDLMPKVTFEDLIPGQSYFVKIWEEGGGTGTLDIRVSDPFQQDYVLAGTAIPLQVGDFNCVQLTAATNSQSGCAWYPTTIDFNQPFEQELAFYFGTMDSNGADGITLVFQPNGIINCGDSGGGIGAQGIPQSWIVEFDTWYNADYAGDIPGDHIAINANGNMSNPVFGPAEIPYNIEDGQIHFVRVRWNPDTYLFEIYFDDALYFSVNYNIVDNVFFGNNIINWGTTASTGGSVNQQYLCFQGITVTNNTSYTFEVNEIICQGTGLFVEGSYQTEAGTYIDVFTAQNGCDSTIYTNIEVVNIEAIATEIIALPCGGSAQVMLDATNSSGAQQPSISWSTSDGMIISGGTTLTPIVEGGGTYTLTYLDLYSGCSDGAVVEVITADIPIANAGNPMTLDCQTTSIQLDGLESSAGSDYTYEWTTLDGTILSDSFSLTPNISAAGTYNLLVTNILSGCSAESSVVIAANQNVPVATAFAENNLDCVTNQIQLNGAGSSDEMGVEYLWESMDGNFISNANTLYPTVSAEGVYTLFVTDTNSGCSSSTTVTVTKNIESPIAIIEPPLILDCTTTQLSLNARNSSQGTSFTYQWTSTNGNVETGQNTLSPTISQSGLYELLITNAENGCTATESVQVQEDLQLPLAEAGENQTLTCTETSVQLDASASDWGTNFTYQWTNLNNNSNLNSTEANPVINTNGIYEILITNTQNGCTATDQVIVELDTIYPQISTTTLDVLTCAETVVSLQATAFNDNELFLYQWTTDDGKIETGEMTLTPTVSSIGNYTLQVENTTNGCISVTQAIVVENVLLPTIVIETPDVLTCTTISIDLQANTNGFGQVFDYQWTSLDGADVQNANTDNPTITTGTNYNLVVTDTENGCTNTATIEVSEDFTPPNVTAGNTQELDCNTVSLLLNATSSENTTVEWTSDLGNILQGQDNLNPEVNAAGTYQIIATNTQNGCTASDAVLITQNNDIPQANAGQGGTLNCLQSSIQLDAMQSVVDDNISFEWTTFDGDFESAMTTLNPIVNQAGTYILTLTDLESNCTAISSVEIFENVEIPVFNINEPAVIDCAVNTAELMVIDLAEGDFTYEWTTSNGIIMSASNTATIVANTAGLYQVQVTDVENGCSEIANVEVFENLDIPTVNLAIPDTLNCQIQSINLETSTSQNTSDWIYEWTSLDGNIISGENTDNPLIDQVGTYELFLMNTANNCTQSTEVLVVENLDTPEVNIAPPTQLNCVTSEVLIDASGTTLAMDYEWTLPSGDVLISNEYSFLATEPGIYQLLVTNDASFCTTTTTVEVIEDISSPIVQIETADTLDCINSNLQLNATSSQGGSFEYYWSSSDLVNIEAETSLQPTISQAGIYDLLVTNTDNQCTAIASVEVFQNTDLPQAIIAMPDILTCTTTSLNLEAEILDKNNDITFLWSSTNGNIIDGAESLQPQIDAAGIYTLSVLNTENNCENEVQIEVLQDIVLPVANIEETDLLTCTTTEITFDANTSSTGNEYVYDWSSSDGNILQNENSLEPVINQVGMYELQVTNIENGCTATAQIVVAADESLPSASIAEPEILNCTVDAIYLQAHNTGMTPLEYLWMSNDGKILENATTLNPLVNQAGTYQLLLTNPENGCTSTQSITVTQDIEAPYAEAGEGSELTCSITDYTLSAFASQGNQIEFSWTTTTGNFINNTNTLNPSVNQAGTYVLTVNNTENGCTASDEVIVFQNENIPTSLSAIPYKPQCFGELGEIVFEEIDGGEEPFLYSIDGGDNFYSETIFNDLSPATYSLLIEDVNGCALDTTLIISDVSEVFVFAESEIQLQIGSSQMIQATTNIPTTELESVLWSPADGLSCTDCLQPTSSNLEDILYTVLVTNTNGCTATAQVQWRVDREINIYIPNAFSPNEDGINDRFTVFSRAGSIKGIQQMLIYDRWGNLVFENQDFQPDDLQLGWDGFLKGKRLNPAVFAYFVEIELVTGEVLLFKGDVTLME